MADLSGMRLISRDRLTALGDAFRTALGTEAPMTLHEMAAALTDGSFGSGKCRMETGTFTGAGYDREFSFPCSFEPDVVLVRRIGEEVLETASLYRLIAVRDWWMMYMYRNANASANSGGTSSLPDGMTLSSSIYARWDAETQRVYAKTASNRNAAADMPYEFIVIQFEQ